MSDYARGTLVCYTDDDVTRYGVVRLGPEWTGTVAIQWWLPDERAWFQGGMSAAEAYATVQPDEPGLPDEVLTCSVAYQLVGEKALEDD